MIVIDQGGEWLWQKVSSAEKKAAVEDYLAGKGSLRDVCAKYKITDTYQLRTWIKQYNGHEILDVRI